jgi:alanine racemase
MLTATELQKSFQWRTKRITHFSVFDVEEAKIVKAELGDNATILVMGLVQDEDMEWVINNDVEFFFLIRTIDQSSKTAKHKKAIIHIG